VRSKTPDTSRYVEGQCEGIGLRKPQTPSKTDQPDNEVCCFKCSGLGDYARECPLRRRRMASGSANTKLKSHVGLALPCISSFFPSVKVSFAKDCMVCHLILNIDLQHCLH
jgi:hypothetical protein